MGYALGLPRNLAFRRHKVPEITGATYYVRPTGSTYGTGDGTSYDNAWSGAANVLWASLPNNTLAICGVHNEGFNVLASDVTIDFNDANESGSIEGLATVATGLNIENRSNVILNTPVINDCTTQSVYYKNCNVIVNNADCNDSGNQAFQHYDDSVVVYNNVKSWGNADEAMSGHLNAHVTLNGTLNLKNNTQAAINAGADSTFIVNGTCDFSGNGLYDIWMTNATTDESCTVTLNNSIISGLVAASSGAKIISNSSTLSLVEIADGVGSGYITATDSIIGSYEDNPDGVGLFTNCLVTISGIDIQGDVVYNKCRVLNDSIIKSGASVTARHTLFSGGDDAQFEFQSGSEIDISYCIFYNMANNQFGVALTTGAIITNFHNCTFNGVSKVGRGLFAREPNTTYNHIFTDLAIGAFQSTGAQTLENCCFFDNTTDKSGTFTSNDEVTTDPLITNAALLDFTLDTGSSCIGTGQTLSDAVGILSADWGNGTTTTPTVTTANQPVSWNIGAFVNT